MGTRAVLAVGGTLGPLTGARTRTRADEIARPRLCVINYRQYTHTQNLNVMKDSAGGPLFFSADSLLILFSVHNAIECRKPKPDIDTSFPFVSAQLSSANLPLFVLFVTRWQLLPTTWKSLRTQQITVAVAKQEVVGNVAAQAAAQPPYKEGDLTMSAPCRCSCSTSASMYRKT